MVDGIPQDAGRSGEKEMVDGIPQDAGRSGEEEPEEEKHEEAEQEDSFVASLRRPSLRRGASVRPDHFKKLVRQKRASLIIMAKIREGEAATLSSAEMQVPDSIKDELTESKLKKLKAETAELEEAQQLVSEINKYFPQDDNRVEVRLKDFSYRVNVDPSEIKIQTVYNQSIFYVAGKFLKRTFGKVAKAEKQTAYVLKDVNLNFEPGKMYLVLGPPASGKTTLLRAIAGRLSTTNGEVLEGSVLYNGLSLKDKRDLYVENVITFVGQLDFHAPRLTVKDTFDFAFQCKSGGTHADAKLVTSDGARDLVKKLDAQDARVNTILKVLGLAHVADTFVGNSEIRGVSGGQRRRVTVGEMVQSNSTPVFCADEMSTGLDAASTFDIVNTIMHFARMNRTTRIISLLQPSPETVSLFDEVILLGGGRVLYAGPVTAVEDYFASLGYSAPDQIDVADFLQVLSTPEGAELYHPPEGTKKTTPYSLTELAEAFRNSKEFQRIEERQNEPFETEWEPTQGVSLALTPTTVLLKKKYQNSGLRSTFLNIRRNLVIWSRDRRFLIANAIKNLIMGVSVGGVFWQTDSVVSIYGVLFQLNLFIMLGAMTSVPEQVNDRIIFYRHADDNFYGAFSYAIGKAISLLPQSLIDILIFGTICYFMVGLATAASNYFIFIALLFVFSVVMNQQISIFTAICATKGDVQAASSCLLLFHLVFTGFIVPPTVIPNYYSWIYWWVPLSWSYRALLVNEFTSPAYDVIGNDETGETEGQMALQSGGMIFNGEPVGTEWIGYCFAYLVPYLVLCTFVTAACLKYIRIEPKSSPPDEDEGAAVKGASDEGEGVVEGNEAVDIPFIPVNLSFSDICYDVKASKAKDTIRLLNNVYGMFESGRMCALMGSSGAGKTTLMDVIALRKTSGTITGSVCLNGFDQEKKSFRRCSGYVEQFDVQQPELTVRETVLFSARLRLNSEDPRLAADEVKERFVDSVLKTLELTSLAHSIVGTDGEGGLSFEQRKRVSIAVELAASPSVIFLDEPTSGLDARAALLVVKTLRAIADEGRTVVATIHQPSGAVFEMFDDLLLLKKGGYTVFAGELGDESHKLVEYFESRGAPEINRGENPANWMLTVITAETDGTDYSEQFAASPDFEALKKKLQKEIDDREADKEIIFDQEFATPRATRNLLVDQRLRTVYWRSPAYNRMRMVISAVIAFILASIFITNRRPSIYTEQAVTAIINTIFISFIIVGVLSINSVLPVMLTLRDTFYRHRAAGMLDHWSLALGLGFAEKWFIVATAFCFCFFYLLMMGLSPSVKDNVVFWGFFCFNTAIYSYFGQSFIACVPTTPTAQICAAVFIGLNNFFSGLIVRPQYLSGFFEIPYWITPGHFVFEGMVMSVFAYNDTPVIATAGSSFYDSLGCSDLAAGQECTGPVSEFVDDFFGGKFQRDHIWYCALACGIFLIMARVVTLFGLKYCNYMNT